MNEVQPLREAAGAGPAEAARGSAELERLGRGELGLEQYLDSQVDRAVAHLAERLPPEQLSVVRETVRAQLTTDPLVTMLTRHLRGPTGEGPTG